MLKLSNNPLPLMLLCTLLVSFTSIINAETLDSQVISAGGDRIVGSDKVMTYSIGQPFVFPNPSSSLQVGFLPAKSARVSDGSGCDTTQAEWACVEFKGMKEAYEVGDMIKIELSLNVNVDRFNRVDLWVVIQYAENQFLFTTPLAFNKFSAQPQAFKTSLDTWNTPIDFLHWELPPGLGGEYTFYGLYVTEGSNPFEHLADLTPIQRSELLIKTTTLANE